MGRSSPLIGTHSLPSHHSKPKATARYLRASVILPLLGLVWLLSAGIWGYYHLQPRLSGRNAYLMEPVLISYSYFEKDPIQVANFEYFLAVGSHYPSQHTNMHWVFVVSGEKCTPCSSLEALLGPPAPGDATPLGVAEARGDAKFTLLRRTENVGLDLGAHNISLSWVAAHGGLGRYRYFIFLNSSAKGPFYPSWLPPSWHWTHAFLEKLQPRLSSSRAAAIAAAGPGGSSSSGGGGEDPTGGGSGSEEGGGGGMPGVLRTTGGGWESRMLPAGRRQRPVAGVGASLVCLPKEDAGGPGPRLESWAFALSSQGLNAALAAGAFLVRGCKLCKDPVTGVVVGGEYGLSAALFKAGFNIATLMSKYDDGIDWTDPSHWSCNDAVHPSRQGTYQGISQHPFETLFVKASWRVAEPYTRRYSAWALDHLLGKPGTAGHPDAARYRYAISVAAQHPRDLERAYDPLATT